MSQADRRRGSRYPLCMPTRIQADGHDEGFGLTRNVSSSGALLGTLRPFTVGDDATLEFELGDRPANSLSARVVRLEINADAGQTTWRYLVAVRFSKPLPRTLLTEVASHTEYLAKA